MTPKFIYLTCPESLIGTKAYLDILEELNHSYPEHHIYTSTLQEPNQKSGCKPCRETLAMDHFPTIQRCSLFAIWAPTITCKMDCEIHQAWTLEKLLIYISYNPDGIDIEPLTLREFHQIRDTTGIDME